MNTKLEIKVGSDPINSLTLLIESGVEIIEIGIFGVRNKGSEYEDNKYYI